LEIENPLNAEVNFEDLSFPNSHLLSVPDMFCNPVAMASLDFLIVGHFQPQKLVVEFRPVYFYDLPQFVPQAASKYSKHASVICDSVHCMRNACISAFTLSSCLDIRKWDADRLS